MIAKAGIIVAAAAASLLAVSPLAFAGDYDGGNGHHSDKGHHSKSHHSNDHDRDWHGNRGGGNSGSCDQNTSADNGRGRGGGGGLLNISGNAIQVGDVHTRQESG